MMREHVNSTTPILPHHDSVVKHYGFNAAAWGNATWRRGTTQEDSAKMQIEEHESSYIRRLEKERGWSTPLHLI